MLRNLAALLLLAFLVPATTAKEASGPAERVLYLDEELRGHSPPPGLPVLDEVCRNGEPIYSFAAELDTPDRSEKAYTGRAYYAGACQTSFAAKLAENLTVEGPGQVRLFVACDTPVLLRVGQGMLATAYVNVVYNDHRLHSQAWHDQSGVCVPGSPKEIRADFSLETHNLSAGNELELVVQFWVTPQDSSAARSFHVLLGSDTHPSSLRLSVLNESADATRASGTGKARPLDQPAENTPGLGLWVVMAVVASAVLFRRR